VFISAQADPLNRMEVPAGYNWTNWPEEDRLRENGLKDRFGADITPQFMLWRRWKIKEIGMDFDKFDEEYPTSPEVAFLASGRPAIPRSMADIMGRMAMPPLAMFNTYLTEVQNNEAIGPAAIHGW
jgi:hypothetical protein